MQQCACKVERLQSQPCNIGGVYQWGIILKDLVRQDDISFETRDVDIYCIDLYLFAKQLSIREQTFCVGYREIKAVSECPIKLFSTRCL